MFQGTIGKYEWLEWREEKEDLRIPDIIFCLKPILKDLYALNTSFDSGLFTPKESDIQLGWSLIDKLALSPQLTEALLDSFPQKYPIGCDGFNEWYFFHDYPTQIPTGAFCNWLGLTIAEHAEVKFSHDFEGDIHRCLPELVLGEGRNLYLIYKPIYREKIFGLLPKDAK